MWRVKYSLCTLALVSALLPVLTYAVYSLTVHLQYRANLKQIEEVIDEVTKSEKCDQPLLCMYREMVELSPFLNEEDRTGLINQIDKRIEVCRDSARECCDDGESSETREGKR